MIITLSGENAFGLAAELQKLESDFVAEHSDIALERLDGEDAELDRIREALTALPFLSSRKLVVLRRPGANKQFAEQAETLLAGVPETTEVIIVEPKLDKRLGYFKFLKRSTDFREFAPLDQNGLARWLAERAKEQGGSLSAADARYLVERVGPNQQLLAGELEKLLLYAPHITRETIDTMTEAAPQSSIFTLLEAAFAGRKKQALALYEDQRAQKVEPPQIIAMLAWQLHVLALLKTAGERSADAVAAEARLSPFVVRKSQGIARQVSPARLKELVSALATIDARSKRQNLDIDEALQNYLLRLSD